MVEIEQPAKARAAPNRVRHRNVVRRRWISSNELASGALVVALGVVVRDEFAEQVAKVPLSKEHEVTLLGFALGKRPTTLRPLRRRGPTPDVLWDTGVLLFRRSNTCQQIVMEGVKTDGRSACRFPTGSDLRPKKLPISWASTRQRLELASGP